MTIGIAVILLAITLTGLSRAKSTAIRMKCVIHARESLNAILVYSTDLGGMFPIQATKQTGGEFSNAGYLLPASSQPFHWPNALRDMYPERIAPSLLCPVSPTYYEAYRDGTPAEVLAEYPKDYMHASTFELSMTAFTDPMFWTSTPYPSSRSPYRPVYLADAVFPSLKGLLIERIDYHTAGPVYGDASGFRPSTEDGSDPALRFTTAMVDGSVRVIQNRDFLPGASLVPPVVRPVYHTENRIKGRDVE